MCSLSLHMIILDRGLGVSESIVIPRQLASLRNGRDIASHGRLFLAFEIVWYPVDRLRLLHLWEAFRSQNHFHPAHEYDAVTDDREIELVVALPGLERDCYMCILHGMGKDVLDVLKPNSFAHLLRINNINWYPSENTSMLLHECTLDQRIWHECTSMQECHAHILSISTTNPASER